MMIEIQRPELEALIRERMKSGAFQDVEDVLMQALKASPAQDAERSDKKSSAMGADLVEAMQASPFKEIGAGARTRAYACA